MSEELINEHLKRLEPFKLEFLDEEDNQYRLDSYIEDVSDDYIIISPPKFEGEKYDLPVGAEVSIVFFRKDGILYAQTTILGQQSSIESRAKLSLPYNVNLYERRGAKRFRLKLKLRIEYYLNKMAFQKKVLNEVTHDISATGVSYISDTPFGKYHNIKCEIYLDETYSDPITVHCRYVYSRRIQVRDETMYHNAFEFSKISREDLQRLQQKCYRKSFD